MKVVLMNAISVDGYIAKTDGDSDWVADDEQFDAAVGKYGCILIGHRTFTQYEGELYPIEGVTTFVYTHEKQQPAVPGVQFVFGEPAEVLQQVKAAGFDAVLLGGGGKTNASFAEAGLIDELILDVHPLMLGDGIRLLGDFSGELRLELLESHNYSGFVQLRYKVA
jgi:dihydrofolate reductase